MMKVNEMKRERGVLTFLISPSPCNNESPVGDCTAVYKSQTGVSGLGTNQKERVSLYKR